MCCKEDYQMWKLGSQWASNMKVSWYRGMVWREANQGNAGLQWPSTGACQWTSIKVEPVLHWNSPKDGKSSVVTRLSFKRTEKCSSLIKGTFLGFLYRARSYDRVLCRDRVVICSRSLYQGFKLVISERNCPELPEAAEVTHESLEVKRLG